MTVQIAASIDYVTLFCKVTFNIEDDVDGLAFVIGTKMKKIVDMVSAYEINIDRLKKASKTPASMIELFSIR